MLFRSGLRYRVGASVALIGETELTASQLSNEAPTSRLVRGAVAARVLANATDPQANDALSNMSLIPPGLYVPRGSTLYIEQTNAATLADIAVAWVDVAGSEGTA